MHFVKKIIQNPDDVRCRSYFKFLCNVCKETKYFDYVSNFDCSKLRVCPNCGTVNDTDNREYLETKKIELKNQIDKLTEEYIKIVNELEVLDVESGVEVIEKKIIS
jgi:hypothetical protein